MAYSRYGHPADVLRMADLSEPKIGPDSVLVDIRAAGVNPVDWQVMAGQLDARFDAVFPITPGWDLAGVVRDTGPNVTRFQPGDEVYGYARADYIHHGTYAERVAVPDRLLAPKPASLDWATAGAAPIAALTAYQALHRLLDVHPGETVLIQAAAGGVGSFAVQIARALGARVIGIGSTRSRSTIDALGAIPVDSLGDIESQVRAITRDGVDAVLDMYGGTTVRTHAALLRRTEGPPRIVSLANDGVRECGGRFLFATPNQADLAELGEIFDSGAVLAPPVTRLPLERAVEALMLSMSGTTHGKIVLEPPIS